MAFKLAGSKDGKNFYTALAADVKDTVGIFVGDVCYETDTLTKWEFNSVAWIKIRGTDSAGNVAGNVIVSDIGPITQGHNRFRTGLAEIYAEATNTVTWPASNNIHEVNILVTATTATAAEENPEDYCLVTLNAANATVASTMLTVVDSQDSDAQADKFLIGERYTIRSKTVITRLDFLPVDVTASISAIHLFVGAH